MKMEKALSLTNVHSLDNEKRKELMRAEYSRISRFQKEFTADRKELVCGPFSEALRAEVIRQLLLRGVAVPDGKLENLHQHIGQDLKDYNFVDGINKISTYLYDTDAIFTDIYHRLIKECLSGYFPYPFYFQATPTIRIHCPGSKNSDHYPRYHSDICYGHPPQEINLWMPLTEPVLPQWHSFHVMHVMHSKEVLEEFDFDLAAFIERTVADKSYNRELDKKAPSVTAPFGSMLAFDSRCIHTVEPLLHHTRISMDIRIVPVEDFQEIKVEYQGTGRRKMRYVPGEAYYAKASNEL